MKIKLTNVRLSFPVLWTPEAFKGGKPDANPKLNYGAAFIMAPTHAAVAVIQKTINDAALEKWKTKAPVKLALHKGNPQKYCFRSGDEKDYDGYAGMLVLAAKRGADRGRPLVLNQFATPAQQGEPGCPYAGCYVDASVDIWAQDGANEGIRATLLGVQFRADGDAFAAGAAPDPGDFSDLSQQGGEMAAKEAGAGLT